MSWLIIVLSLIAGSIMLYYGSEWLVRGAKGIALRLGVSPFVIGLTVVAFGSSAPECITSIVSTSNPSLIIGNVVGSNIANVGLAIGLASIAAPLAAKYKEIRIEMYAMVLSAFGLLVLAILGYIGMWVGIALILLLFVFLYMVFTRKKGDKDARAAYEDDVDDEEEEKFGTPLLAVLTVAGLVILYFGARFFIDGAKGLAEALNVPELIIGLIVVAIGTSLPEICISFMAARRGEADLAVANIVGSNIFNILFVLGVGASLVDIPVSESLLYYHLPVMIILTLAMFFVVRSKNRITRPYGLLFVGIYGVYIAIMAMVPSLMM